MNKGPGRTLHSLIFQGQRPGLKGFLMLLTFLSSPDLRNFSVFTSFPLSLLILILPAIFSRAESPDLSVTMNANLGSSLLPPFLPKLNLQVLSYKWLNRKMPLFRYIQKREDKPLRRVAYLTAPLPDEMKALPMLLLVRNSSSSLYLLFILSPPFRKIPPSLPRRQAHSLFLHLRSERTTVAAEG